MEGGLGSGEIGVETVVVALVFRGPFFSSRLMF